MNKNSIAIPEIKLTMEKDMHSHIILRYEDDIFRYLAEKQLNVLLQDISGEIRVYPVFQQKAGNYGKYSDYMRMHGCACCSLTTILAAKKEEYRFLRPNDTIEKIEKRYLNPQEYGKNYRKHIRRQMPVSLFGITQILAEKKIKYRHIPTFSDEDAEKEITRHLQKGKPVIIETSRFRRKNGHIIRLNDKKYAGSYHTMILLGFDKEGKVIFTDSATRSWAKECQRLKWAELPELIQYMFPQKNVADQHVYFTRRKNTGGYILVE